MSRKITWGLVILAVLGIVPFFNYGFRVEHKDNPALGLFEYRYRWWKPRQITVDSNRDGTVDARALLERGASDFKDPLRDYWEDRDSDGYFEIHAVFAHGTLEMIEIDDDADGVYERRITGVDATEFFKRTGAQER